MEVITFESKAYQDLVQKIENIADYVTKNKLDATPKTEVWLNSNEVADLLNISIRTLQRLRDDNMISYTMLRGRCLYKLTDIEKSLQERIIPTDQRTLDRLRNQHVAGSIFNCQDK
ncbi:helix-turn-helix domain-containing protein [Maribellus maritimus]|uniref:helix-turn-helix domain-containing protein n=1 Tax=Maribellus maritimus TaxID=2870838 RepID=UPI001EEABB34|nr:helix-turn-helix domain-containing protein [Maribellus maritimus]MCG6191172.1 helix-turn-helix domain-containing protein [Maribellus maritimus]